MRTASLIALFMLAVSTATFSADSAPGTSNWDKFKQGAKQAGSAAWSGTKNVAESVSDGAHRAGEAVARGARKTGETVAEGYEEVKEFVQEKTDKGRAEQETPPTLPEQVPPPAPTQ